MKIKVGLFETLLVYVKPMTYSVCLFVFIVVVAVVVVAETGTLEPPPPPLPTPAIMESFLGPTPHISHSN